MAPNSVDDMYKGCEKKMEKKVINKYFKEEFKGTFETAWKRAGECAKQSHPEDKDLTKNHMQAICAYTAKFIHEEFNNAVRHGKSNYTNKKGYRPFKFHSLHFWLTTAIQILNKKRKCQTSYRGTKVEFTGKPKSTIRFGAFTSSSKFTNATEFGTKTCFEIKTCFGAYLKNYSAFEDEGEVLIPPYETFKITKVIEGWGKYRPMPVCEKVFILKSSSKKSNVNCKAAK